MQGLLLPFGTKGKGLLYSIALWIAILGVISIIIVLPVYFLVINKSDSSIIVSTTSAPSTTSASSTTSAPSPTKPEVITITDFYPTGTVLPFDATFYSNKDAITKSIYYLTDFINKCTTLFNIASMNNLKNMIYTYIIEYHNIITEAQNYLSNTNPSDIISLQTVSLLSTLASKLNDLQNKQYTLEIIPIIGNPNGVVNSTCTNYICQSKYLLQKLEEYKKNKYTN